MRTKERGSPRWPNKEERRLPKRPLGDEERRREEETVKLNGCDPSSRGR